MWMLYVYCRLEYEMRNQKKEEKELKIANANSSSQEWLWNTQTLNSIDDNMFHCVVWALFFTHTVLCSHSNIDHLGLV